MKERILKLLQTPHHELRTAEEIYHDLNLQTEEDYDMLGDALISLEDDYLITHNKKNQFALLTYFNMVKGNIIIKDSGFGFVDTLLFSVHIGEGKTKTAMNNDTVIVKFHSYNGKNYEGEVERIIKRNVTTLVGPLIKRKNRYFVKGIIDRSVIWCSVKNVNKIKTDDVVKVKITKYFTYDQVEGEILEVCGKTYDVGMDITTRVIASGVKYEFEKETLDEARKIPQVVNTKDYKNRKDLTSDIMITIDGDDAKDFDDAVTLEILANGNYNLKVAIADVSEYVKENSFLDLEAYTRGTSIYLPDRVIPMLPFELSNGICSLNEGVDRLVMVASIELTKEGKIVSTDHFEGIIRSKHRMTYSIVNKILEENDQELIDKYQDIYEMLSNMERLAKTLYDIRIKRGSFDFETDEAKLTLDKNGKTIDISLRERRTAEKLIEEFMLLANESVAEKMTWLDVPFIYRVHDEPDELRLKTFMNRLKALKQEFSYKNKQALPKSLQQFLLDTTSDENPLEKTLKSVISNTLLRTMAKAKYQEINIGHYGLASKCYTHFTSPIRRYPDLLVHRLMKEFLFNIPQTDYENSYEYFTKKVIDSAITSSNKEKLAVNLERTTTDMKKCEYMEQFIGKTFTGMISSVVNWGLYVTLDNTVEGLVRFEHLPRDYYDVDEVAGAIYGKNHTYRMGDIVKVKVIDVSIIKHQIAFRLMEKSIYEK